MADRNDAPVLLVGESAWRDIRGRATALVPTLRAVTYAGPDPLPDEALADVTIGYFSGDAWPERTPGLAVSMLKSDGLRWMQTFSAGVDNKFFDLVLAKGTRLTTASGASASPIAQTVVMYLLALSRDLRGFVRSQEAHRWEPREIEELDGSTLLVAGTGPIGSEVARLGEALGMTVEAVRRSPRGDEPRTTWPIGRLHEALGRADWVVSALPLADGTRGIFGADAFAAMRPGARFVNVGRGELVDEAAMIGALRSGRLAGAALDVFAVEPLPPDSPLWDMPNVIVTPHSSGESSRATERVHDLFLDNLARWTSGRSLVNEVVR